MPTFIGVSLVSFLFIRLLPGDPIMVMAGERGMSDERHAALMTQFGYDQPLYAQYRDYVVGILQGDLGISFNTKRPGVGRVLRAVPGNARTVALRDRVPRCCWACRPASSPRSIAASGPTSC